MKALAVLIGLAMMAVGVWLCTLQTWQKAVVAFLQGGIVIMLLVIGLGVFVFAVSELRASGSEAGGGPPVSQPSGEEKKE